MEIIQKKLMSNETNTKSSFKCSLAAACAYFVGRGSFYVEAVSGLGTLICIWHLHMEYAV